MGRFDKKCGQIHQISDDCQGSSGVAAACPTWSSSVPAVVACSSLEISRSCRERAARSLGCAPGSSMVVAIRRLSASRSSRWVPLVAASTTVKFLRWGAVSPGLTARSAGFEGLCHGALNYRANTGLCRYVDMSICPKLTTCRNWQERWDEPAPSVTQPWVLDYPGVGRPREYCFRCEPEGMRVVLPLRVKLRRASPRNSTESGAA
jgi:hypothetical protein